MAKDKNKSKELPPIDTSKLDAKKYHSYKRDPVTGDLIGIGEATKPSLTTQNKGA
jgi:hypothetical protein